MKPLILALVLLLTGLDGNAATLRCGRKLVMVGDSQLEVLAKCGEPASSQERSRIDSEILHHPGRTLDYAQHEEVIIEEWVYNFGPRHLMQMLRFENGVLREIDNLGYGY